MKLEQLTGRRSGDDAGLTTFDSPECGARISYSDRTHPVSLSIPSSMSARVYLRKTFAPGGAQSITLVAVGAMIAVGLATLAAQHSNVGSASTSVVALVLIALLTAQMIALRGAVFFKAVSSTGESDGPVEGPASVMSGGQTSSPSPDPIGSGTSAKRAEHEDFFDESAVAALLVGPDGSIVRVNRAELDLFGYSAEEYIGHHVSEFYLDRSVALDAMNRLRRGQRLRGWEVQLRAKDGSVRYALIDSNPQFKQGKFARSLIFTRDVTETKRVEGERIELLAREQAARARAEESEELVRKLQTIIDISLMRLPLDSLLREMLGRIREQVSADAAAVLLFAEDSRALVTRAVVGQDGTDDDLSANRGQNIAVRIAASRAPLLVNDDESENSDNNDGIRSTIGAPLMIKTEIIGVIYAVAKDAGRFTERELPLFQLVADRVALAVEHARLYEAEQRARLSAEAANRMKDEFLATVSHELRSPLNAILGWMKLLRAGRLDEEASAHALETVERSAKSQSRIIGDLLDVSRIISGKLLLKVRPIEPVRAIEAAVEAVRPGADAKGVRLETELDPAAGPISGDADRLQQIVWNLLSNAIKFTSTGGLVQVHLKQIGGLAEIEVRDSGIGISPDFLPYVFDRFRQADASSSRRQGGLGLGLAIVRHLVELHGGTVAVHSVGEGEGSRFIVRLPRAIGRTLQGGTRGARRHSDEMPGYGLIRLTGLKVLIVDDDADARDLMNVILSQSCADVRTVSSAGEAFDILSKQGDWTPDVLVSDIEMPGTDGYTLIQRIRRLEDERGGRIPAVAVTAYSRVEDRMRALAAGFQLHIAKPVEPGELLTVLASLSGRSKGRWSNPT